MTIRPRLPQEELPASLLLLADPDWAQVKKYLDASSWTVAEESGEIVGVCGLMTLDRASAEIMNVAVDPAWQGKGLGKQLIQFALHEARSQGYDKVIVRTGNSSLNQLGLYQKCGFRMVRIERDYFVNNYPEPIYENGIPCRDQIVLEMAMKE
ncbi:MULTISPECIES: GNAT family N-acetyltransferase [Paenibacillus]|uniref:N-acetyltransferase n=1 Tax=Paenibacillus albilobatus TaxID=2716884 RepID=A0A919XGE3_9BACL|nr:MULTISPECIES: GNAT family N-acetyltransferase [Paenibacillus]GIO29913.1 N-acetyltransferase [Paenibacillus albilobatus]